MLTKEQRHFRREMKKIKKEKGALYDEIYDQYTPTRQRKSTAINYNWVIRLVLFIALFVWPTYKSSTAIPMVKGRETLAGFTSPLTSQKQQACSDCLQAISVISQDLHQAINNYAQEKISFLTTKEEINRLRGDLEQVEIVEDGESLREVLVERLAVSLHYIEVLEDLRMIRVVRTDQEKKIWEQKNETAQDLRVQLENKGIKQIEEVKSLLEKYNMTYIENESGLNYHLKEHL